MFNITCSLRILRSTSKTSQRAAHSSAATNTTNNQLFGVSSPSASTTPNSVLHWTGFDIFAKQAWRSSVLTDDPNRTFLQKSRVVSTAWSKLSDARKQEYQELSKNVRIVHVTDAKKDEDFASLSEYDTRYNDKELLIEDRENKRLIVKKLLSNKTNSNQHGKNSKSAKNRSSNCSNNLPNWQQFVKKNYKSKLHLPFEQRLASLAKDFKKKK